MLTLKLVRLKKSYWKILAGLTLALYFLILIKLILFKGHIGSVFYSYPKVLIRTNLVMVNLVPFNNITNIYNNDLPLQFKLQNIVGNILGFCPLGFLLPVLSRYFSSYWTIALAGLTVSYGFEFTQLVKSLGIFDVDDLMLNTLGTIIGFFLYKIVTKILSTPSMRTYINN